MDRWATWRPAAFQCQHANQLGLLSCGPHSSSMRARGLERWGVAPLQSLIETEAWRSSQFLQAFFHSITGGRNALYPIGINLSLEDR